MPADSPRDGQPTEPWRHVLKHLRRGELSAVRALFPQVVRSELSVDDIEGLQKGFQKNGHADLFSELLLAADVTAFQSLASAGQALRMAAALNREGEVEPGIREVAKARGLRWAGGDYLKNIVARKDPLVTKLLELKYPDLPEFRVAGDLISYAEKISDRVVVDPSFLDYVYSRRATNDLPRDLWERRVRTAFCIDHVTSDVQLDPGWHVVIDETASKAALQSLDQSQGTLLLGAHAGFTQFMITWVRTSFPDFVVVAGGGRGDPPAATKLQKVTTRNDARGSLFALFRALLDGRTVLMAPDARIGESHSSLAVFDVREDIADGAAFLAYETRCNAAWIGVVREGDRFVPQLIAAPPRQEQESYDDFKRRFFAFFAAQIESLMSGNPDNIVAKPRWTRTLRQQEGPTI